jgi:hypothetical protein
VAKYWAQSAGIDLEVDMRPPMLNFSEAPGAIHGFGTKLPDGLQKSLRLGSFCQNLRKDCKSNVLQSGVVVMCRRNNTPQERYRGSTHSMSR